MMSKNKKEPSGGGSAARHEKDLTIEQQNAKIFDTQGHHYAGETEPRKKFSLKGGETEK